jgi:LysM repeat protein
MKSFKSSLLFLVLLAALIPMGIAQSAAPSPYDLVVGVNELRQNQGLSPLETDGALMAAAQNQADYLASTYGTNFPTWDQGHVGAGGTAARDRAVAAGYALGPGMNVVENWAGGNSSTTLSDVIYQYWSDEAHWNTMTTIDGIHIGAGVAEGDGFVYFILNVGVKYGSGGTGGGGAASSVPTTAVTAQVAPVKVSTPDVDGKITHEVDTGQALWSIAAAYEITVEQLQALNNLTDNTVIYVGQELLIQTAYTPTVSPTTTVTPRSATRTPIPPQTAEEVVTQTVQDDTGAGGFLNMGRSTLGLVLVLISGVGLALMAISIAGRNQGDKNGKADS